MAWSVVNFQKRVWNWMLHTFHQEERENITVRCDRFLEEALELLQSLDYPVERIDKLRDYVYSRPKGVPMQELGGTMITLAALCGPTGMEMDLAADIELSRCWTNMEKIRAKQAMKRDKLGPLP